MNSLVPSCKGINSVTRDSIYLHSSSTAALQPPRKYKLTLTEGGGAFSYYLLMAHYPLPTTHYPPPTSPEARLLWDPSTSLSGVSIRVHFAWTLVDITSNIWIFVYSVSLVIASDAGHNRTIEILHISCAVCLVSVFRK